MQLAMPEKAAPPRQRRAAVLLLLFIAAATGGLYWYYSGRIVLQGEVGTLSLTLYPEIAGTVSKVTARAGEQVQAGQPLVFLDASALQTTFAEAQNTLARLEAELPPEHLRRSRQTPDPQQETMEQLLTRQFREEEAARRALHEASTAEAQTAFAYNRASILAAEGKLPQQQKEATRQNNLAARERLARSRAEFEAASLARAATEADIRRSKAAQKQAGVDEVPANLRIRAYEAQAARTRQAAAALEATVVRAPRDGVVTAVEVAPGASLAAGQPVLSMIPTDAPPAIVAFAPEQDAAKIRVGQPCSVAIPSSPHSPFTGKVLAVLPRARPWHANATELEAFSRSRMQVRVALDIPASASGEAAGAQAIPEQLLLPDNADAVITVYLREPLFSGSARSEEAAGPSSPEQGPEQGRMETVPPVSADTPPASLSAPIRNNRPPEPPADGR